jgi:hypothetical protein
MAENSQQQVQQPVEKRKVTISELKGLLKQGIDRKGIAKHYGVSQAEVTAWFQNPKLKGARVRPAPTVELVDDEPDAEVVATPAAQQTTTSAPDTTSVVQAQNVTAGEPIKEVAESGNDEVSSTKGSW